MFNRRGRGQFCVAWRLFSRFLADPIRLPFLRCAAVLCAMRIERRNAAHDKRRDCHHHKKPNRFEFSGHEFDASQSHAILADKTYVVLHHAPEIPLQFPT